MEKRDEFSKSKLNAYLQKSENLEKEISTLSNPIQKDEIINQLMRLCLKIINICVESKQYQKIFEQCEKIEQLYDLMNGDKSRQLFALADSINLRGSVCYQIDQYKDAIGYFKRAILLLRNNTARAVTVRAFYYTNLGNVYMEQGRYEKAIICLKHAGKLYLEQNENQKAINCFNRLPGFCLQLGETDRAIDYLDALSDLCIKLNLNESATDYLQELIGLCEELIETENNLNITDKYSFWINKLANLYFVEKNYLSVINLFQKIANHECDARIYLKSYCNLATESYAQKDWYKTITYCEQALNTISKQINKGHYSNFNLNYLLLERQYLLKLREAAYEQCEYLRHNILPTENLSSKRFNLC